MQPGAKPQGSAPEAAPEVPASDEGEPESPPGARARASSWATASPYRLPLGVAAVGVVVSAPFGGWRAAAPEPQPVVEVQETVDAAPFEVELERAYHTPLPSDSFVELDPGQEYVVVLGTVTSRHDSSVSGSLFSQAVEAVDLPDPVSAGGDPAEEGDPVTGLLYSAQDSTLLRQVGPDLAHEFGLVFISAAGSFPEELTLEISGYTWRQDTFTQLDGWHDPAAVARVVVPLSTQRDRDR